MLRYGNSTAHQCRSRFSGFVLAVVLTVAVGHVMAQQDEGPILRPKKPPAKPAGATLLVMCDLACNWKLDGEAKGHIDAGGSAKAKVELGQHVVDAATEDGADKVENEIEVETAGQTIVRVALQPVRDAGLKAEQQARDKADREARDKAAQEQRDKAAREQQEREQKAREQAAREQQEREQKERERAELEGASGVWTDPATGLMWTKKDNGKDFTWHQANHHCRNLRLAGHSDWRLPTIDELQGIYDKDANVPGHQGGGSPATWHVKGDLELSGWEWSNSQGGHPGEAWNFLFSSNGGRSTNATSRFIGGISLRALCVRGSGQ